MKDYDREKEISEVKKLFVLIAAAGMFAGFASVGSAAAFGPHPDLPSHASPKAHASVAASLKGDTADLMPCHVAPSAHSCD